MMMKTMQKALIALSMLAAAALAQPGKSVSPLSRVPACLPVSWRVLACERTRSGFNLVSAPSSARSPQVMRYHECRHLQRLLALAGSTSGTAACPKGNGMSNTLKRNDTHYTLSATSCPQYSPYGQKTPNTPTIQTTTAVSRAGQGIAQMVQLHASIHACAI